MAELVQLHLESFVLELEQMERIGLLCSGEMKVLLKKKKALEYVLHQRTKTVEDYMKCIQVKFTSCLTMQYVNEETLHALDQYEINVLSLICKRRQRLKCELELKDIGDSVATRIYKLFKAAISHFPNEEKLWMSQIKFCQRMKWHHTISGIFKQMLQVHNSKPELWVLAAKWEFEENNAPENARNIYQQALRFHQDSRLLWTEYFRMELMHIDSILKRKVALDSQGAEDSENDGLVQGKLASAVYKKATWAIRDADFAISLIDVCREFDFTCNHIDRIYEDIQHRHPMSEVILDTVARRPLFTIGEELKNAKAKGLKLGKVIFEIEEKVCALYEEALEKVKSEKMWSYYIGFAIGRWDSTKNKKKKPKFLDNVFKLMEQANDAGLLSDVLFVKWCDLLEMKGDEDLCCSVALEAARKWPKMVSLWVLCLTIHMQARKENTSAILNEALENLSEKKSLPVWNLGMQWLSLSSPSELKEYFEEGIQNLEISAQVKEMYLEATALRDGIEAARKLYKKLRYLFPVSPEMFRKMIHIEKAQLKSSIKWLRIYYEDAICEFGCSDVDFWIEYILLELEHPDGDTLRLQMYHWRALNTLDEENTESFVTKYTLLSTGHKEELFW